MTASGDLTRLHAHEMSALLRRGEIGSVELLEAHQALIERQQHALNAWQSVDPAGARSSAEASFATCGSKAGTSAASQMSCRPPAAG